MPRQIVRLVLRASTLLPAPSPARLARRAPTSRWPAELLAHPAPRALSPTWALPSALAVWRGALLWLPLRVARSVIPEPRPLPALRYALLSAAEVSYRQVQ